MYFGIVLLTGHFLWFGYQSLLLYGVIVFVLIHLFVVLYEEPTLRGKFGASYEAYRKRVPRWSQSCPGNDVIHHWSQDIFPKN
jgi:protein-S-isoprenylcysteine O-methyltransferase Ste14